MTTDRYAVDVTVSSHDALKDGVTEVAGWRVLISADHARNDNEALLLAAQMASCHGMCTGAVLVSWPTWRAW